MDINTKLTVMHDGGHTQDHDLNAAGDEVVVPKVSSQIDLADDQLEQRVRRVCFAWGLTPPPEFAAELVERADGNPIWHKKVDNFDMMSFGIGSAAGMEYMAFVGPTYWVWADDPDTMVSYDPSPEPEGDIAGHMASATVVDPTWRVESAKALDASEDGTVDWTEVLAKTEYEGFRMRANLPASALARYDTQVARALAPHVAVESVRHIEHQMGGERNDKVEWTDPSVAPKARATGVAVLSQMWLSRFPKADPAKVEPVLVAELIRAAGDDLDMAALLPQAVPLVAQHPANADQLTELGHWKPPFIELPI